MKTNGLYIYPTTKKAIKYLQKIIDECNNIF